MNRYQTGGTMEDIWDFGFSAIRRQFWYCQGQLEFRFEFDGQGMNFDDNASVIKRAEAALTGLQQPDIRSSDDTELHISSSSPVDAALYITLPPESVDETELVKLAMSKVRSCLQTEFVDTQ